MLIEAGKMNTPITIQEKAKVKSASGAVGFTWQNIAVAPQVWAEKFDRSGVQGFVSDQDLSKVTARFRIHYREDVLPAMRIVCKGKFYNIHFALDLTGQNEFLELMCETGGNDG